MEKVGYAARCAVGSIVIIAVAAAGFAALFAGSAGIAWIFELMRGLFPSEGC